jgi:hypothetical protein
MEYSFNDKTLTQLKNELSSFFLKGIVESYDMHKSMQESGDETLNVNFVYEGEMVLLEMKVTRKNVAKDMPGEVDLGMDDTYGALDFIEKYIKILNCDRLLWKTKADLECGHLVVFPITERNKFTAHDEVLDNYFCTYCNQFVGKDRQVGVDELLQHVLVHMKGDCCVESNTE